MTGTNWQKVTSRGVTSIIISISANKRPSIRQLWSKNFPGNTGVLGPKFLTAILVGKQRSRF